MACEQYDKAYVWIKEGDGWIKLETGTPVTTQQEIITGEPPTENGKAYDVYFRLNTQYWSENIYSGKCENIGNKPTGYVRCWGQFVGFELRNRKAETWCSGNKSTNNFTQMVAIHHGDWWVQQWQPNLVEQVIYESGRGEYVSVDILQIKEVGQTTPIPSQDTCRLKVLVGSEIVFQKDYVEVCPTTKIECLPSCPPNTECSCECCSGMICCYDKKGKLIYSFKKQV